MQAIATESREDTTTALAKVSGKELSPQDRSHRAEILRRAQAGDAQVLPHVRRIVQEAPAAGLFPLARNTESAMLATMYGQNLLAAEDTRRQLRHLREELAGPAPTPLEELLIERIALCHLESHYHQTIYAQCLASSHLTGKAHAHFQDRIDRADRRYLASIKTLAQVRKLQLPSVQVNIAAQGGQQLNIGHAERAPGSLPPAPQTLADT